MKKHFLAILITSLIIGLFFSLLFGLGFFSSWSAKLTDKLFLQGKPSEKIVIVAIDNDSLQAIGRWPWEREVHAQLIYKISGQNPSVIGLDVNFSETSSFEADRELAQSIKDAGNVILPVEAELSATGDRIVASNVLFPIGEIKDAALGLGVTNIPPDRDGIFRKLPLTVYGGDNQEYASFSLAIAEIFIKKIQLYLPDIPVDKRGRMAVNYVGRPGTFTTVSALDVISGKIEDNIFKNKIVFIGATAPDLHDEQLTPVSSSPMSGVEIHANAVNTIITDNFLIPLNFYWYIALFVFLALLVNLVLNYFKINIGSLIVLIILAAYFIISLIIFDRGVLMELFYVLLVVVFTSLFAIVFRFIVEEKEKRQIKNAFSRYVSPDVIDELLAHPDKLKLGGEEKELTILFSDIRGFTSISEKLTPVKLVKLLNEYLNVMTNLIMESRGTVDKYIGDAIMALWGAPLDEPDHAAQACRAALLMIKKLTEERHNWQKEFGVELNIGVGINTGRVVIGNMGSDKRFDYTVMGDSVNLASRLEGATKQYGVRIIVSEFTKKQTEDKFVFRYLDKVAVKGKVEGVEIYELMGSKEEIGENNKDLINLFSEGVELYQRQNWDKAIEVFNNLLKQYPDDNPVKLYLSRLRELKNNPPGENWDGVYRLIDK